MCIFFTAPSKHPIHLIITNGSYIFQQDLEFHEMEH